jgi:hypothetical protein
MMRRSERGSEDTELLMSQHPTQKRLTVSFHPAYSVFCPYCGAKKHELCSHTMLPDAPVLDEPHQTRVDYARELSE